MTKQYTVELIENQAGHFNLCLKGNFFHILRIGQTDSDDRELAWFLFPEEMSNSKQNGSSEFELDELAAQLLEAHPIQNLTEGDLEVLGVEV